MPTNPREALNKSSVQYPSRTLLSNYSYPCSREQTRCVHNAHMGLQTVHLTSLGTHNHGLNELRGRGHETASSVVSGGPEAKDHHRSAITQPNATSLDIYKCSSVVRWNYSTISVLRIVV